MNYSGSSSNYSIIIADPNTNGTLADDSVTSPYNDKALIVLMYLGISLLFGVPILIFLLCIYKMRGDAPCNLKEACCECCL